jgi:hypothetical protein
LLGPVSAHVRYGAARAGVTVVEPQGVPRKSTVRTCVIAPELDDDPLPESAEAVR